MSMHDRWLAAYRNGYEMVWCSSSSCPNRAGVDVEWESEYGQSWNTPEDCPLCGSAWLHDQPDDDGEDADGTE